MRKYKILFIFLLGIILFNITYAKENTFPLIGKSIYLDAGHGGKDPGAFYKNIYEEDINLSIVLKLREKLESKGAIIYLTRDGDYDLSNPNAYLRKKSDLGNRALVINDSLADIYLSVHLNASTNTSWKGAQVFYDDINEKNKSIADIFQKHFNKNLNSKRKSKRISTLYMYKNIKIPGVLLEVGFITNPDERYILLKDNYQDKIVDTIYKSLLEILI